jgi:hypothetical protein
MEDSSAMAVEIRPDSFRHVAWCTFIYRINVLHELAVWIVRLERANVIVGEYGDLEPGHRANKWNERKERNRT